MKILIDECVPRPIAKFLVGHSAKTAQEIGWGAYKNGQLLRLAENEYDLFITADKNIRYQQNLTDRNIAILVLSTNHWETIRVNSDKIVAAVEAIAPADFVELLLSLGGL
ncbi:MAG: DUF5615 family PIN-like protein [Blastocatellia bacterium]